MVGGGSLPPQPSGLPSISPSMSSPAISMTPISGSASAGASRRFSPRATAPERSTSLMRLFNATRSAGETLKARTMSRLPTGVGLPAMKSRISSRVGRRPSERRAWRSARSLGVGLFRGFGRRTCLRFFPGARLGTRRFSFSGRFRRGLWRGRFRLGGARLALAPWLRGGAVALDLGGLRREQLDRFLRGRRFGLDVARQRRVDAAMADIGTVAAVEQVDGRAVARVIAQDAQRRARAAAVLARLGEQRDGAIEPDGQHIIARLQRAIDVAVLDIRTEAADA